MTYSDALGLANLRTVGSLSSVPWVHPMDVPQGGPLL
jgi:hypothetical protein